MRATIDTRHVVGRYDRVHNAMLMYTVALCCRLLCYRKIYVICDNARSHHCKLVQRYLRQWGHRIVLHYLPTYAPDTIPLNGCGGICTKKSPVVKGKVLLAELA